MPELWLQRGVLPLKNRRLSVPKMWRPIQSASSRGRRERVSQSLTYVELDLIRQWFNAVRDLNMSYLTEADFSLAQKIAEMLTTKEGVSA